jgi:hypothetical protein
MLIIPLELYKLKIHDFIENLNTSNICTLQINPKSLSIKSFFI